MDTFSNLSFQFDALSPVPKYKQIAEQLASYLRQERIPGGSKLPNDRDLAKIIGTAVMTLSRALNELVAEGLLERKVGSGTYVCSRENCKKALHRIAVVCHQPITMDGGFVSTLLAELSTQAAQFGVDLLQLQRSPQEYEEMIRSFRLDGIIVLSAPPEIMPRLAEFVENGMNLVQVGVWHRDYASFSLGTDHRLVALQAVRRLVGKGHKSIGYIVGKQIDGNVHISNSMRIEGYQRGMWEARLPFNPSWILSDTIPAPTLEAQLQQLIQSGDMPDAFLLGSLPMAPRVYHILQKLHLRIPEDVALVTFDDSYLCQQMTPTLTACSQNIPVLVQKILEKLTNRDGNRAEQDRPVSAVWTERGSC